jgi:hypothetical protein
LWTGLREVEGLDYEATLKELKQRYPSDQDMQDSDDGLLPQTVPGPIRDMADSHCAIEALGAMIWCVFLFVRVLAIDHRAQVFATIEYRQRSP